MFGYAANTKIKFIIVIDDSFTEVKEADVKMVWLHFHDAHTDSLSRSRIRHPCIHATVLCRFHWLSLRALPEVIQFFKDFHRIYVDTVMNPFYIPDERIESRKFERRLQQLVNSFGKSEGK